MRFFHNPLVQYIKARPAPAPAPIQNAHAYSNILHVAESEDAAVHAAAACALLFASSGPTCRWSVNTSSAAAAVVVYELAALLAPFGVQRVSGGGTEADVRVMITRVAVPPTEPAVVTALPERLAATYPHAEISIWELLRLCFQHASSQVVYLDRDRATTTAEHMLLTPAFLRTLRLVVRAVISRRAFAQIGRQQFHLCTVAKEKEEEPELRVDLADIGRGVDRLFARAWLASVTGGLDADPTLFAYLRDEVLLRHWFCVSSPSSDSPFAEKAALRLLRWLDGFCAARAASSSSSSPDTWWLLFVHEWCDWFLEMSPPEALRRWLDAHAGLLLKVFAHVPPDAQACCVFFDQCIVEARARSHWVGIVVCVLARRVLPLATAFRTPSEYLLPVGQPRRDGVVFGHCSAPRAFDEKQDPPPVVPDSVSVSVSVSEKRGEGHTYWMDMYLLLSRSSSTAAYQPPAVHAWMRLVNFNLTSST